MQKVVAVLPENIMQIRILQAWKKKQDSLHSNLFISLLVKYAD